MILVTGGAGYIGSHFVGAYLRRYPERALAVVDNLSTGHYRSLPHESDRVRFYQHDVSDSAALNRIFSDNKITAVVHFAGNCYVGESQSKPLEYFDNNVGASIKLFQCMETHGVRRIVFSSSCATYGLLRVEPMDETHPQEPVNVYGTTKLMVEQVLQSLCGRLQWSAIVLRYFNVAGAADNGLLGESHLLETHVVPNILKAAAGELEYFELYGDDYDTADGTCIRDYVHVEDLVHGHILALDHLETAPGFDAVNLGSGRGCSVRQLIELCSTITETRVPVKVSARRTGDPSCLVTSIARAESRLRWTPSRTLEEMIQSARAWQSRRLF